MKLKVQIVEDDPLTAFDLKEVLTENQFEVVGVSKSYEEALKTFHTKKPEVILADVKLGSEKDGIDFVNTINSPSIVCPVVYLTGNSDIETKARAFDTNPSTFLTKPFNSNNVVVSLELAFDRFNKELELNELSINSGLFVKKGDQFLKIHLSEIVLIKAEGSYSRIVTHKDEYLLSGNLKSYSERLHNCFIRTHRSFLINYNKVTAIDTQNVHLGNHSVPIGRRYKNNVREKIKRFP